MGSSHLTNKKKFLALSASGRSRCLFISVSNLQNPRLYKYDWWVYPFNSLYDSAAEVFFKPEHRLSTKEFYKIADRLYEEKIGFACTSRKRHRLESTIWNYEKLKHDNPNIIFAIAYDDDTDEDCEGHK